MVEASGYLFQDVEVLLKRAKELMEEAKIEAPLPSVQDRYREALDGSMQKLDEISSRYREDAEASLIRKKLSDFLEELESGNLTPEMEAERLERIVDEVHHLVEWRRLSSAAGRDISLKSRRRTRDDFHKR